MTDTGPATTLPATVAPKTNAVAVRQPQRGDFAPLSMPEAIKFAEAIQNADGMIPKAYLRNPGKILACIMAGQELGVGPMAALRAFHVVEGKPTADYSFWIARLRAAGYKVEWLERGQEKVTLQLTAPNGAKHVETWDKARAVTAGLWGKNTWKNHPQTMLSARCVTSAGRAFAAEVMFGCYETDEAEEIMREAIVHEVKTVPNGPAPERAAAAAGSAVDSETAAREAKARECFDMARALELSRDDVFDLYKELQIEHVVGKTRMGELPMADLERLAEKLDEIQAERSKQDAGGDGAEAQP